MANRVKKIAETTGPINVTWKKCPSDLNQADLRSRGVTIAKIERGNLFYWSRLALKWKAVATAVMAEQHQIHGQVIW